MIHISNFISINLCGSLHVQAYNNDNIVATLNTTVSIITGRKAPYCMQYRDCQTHVRHALRRHLKDKKQSTAICDPA